MSTLQSNHYGKHRVRLLRVQRRDDWHEVAEWETDVVVEGDLAGSYLGDDNSSIVATDTIKNTVLALAHDHNDVTRDGFALLLAEHFLTRYAHLTAVDVEVREHRWNRMVPGGVPHPHTFVREGNGLSVSVVRQERGLSPRRGAGIRGLVILKTTASGFAGYPRCEFTTLPETTDRILSTSMDATWQYQEGAAGEEEKIVASMLKVFAETYSPSVQRTLYQMGEAALAACEGLDRIQLTMPNRHYLNINLEPLGRPVNQRQIFQPTDDPYGFIEAVVTR